MDQEIQTEIQNILGNWGWLVTVGFLAVLFRSTLEGLVESFKVFAGRGINTDDCIFIWIEGTKKCGRVVRVGLFKTTLTIYTVNYTTDGEPYIAGGEKMEIQNSKISEFKITKAIDKIDLSSWKNGFNGKKGKNK